VHADTHSLIIASGYSAHPAAHTHWFHDQTKEEMEIGLLKTYAEKLGYRVVKKSTKKE